MITMIIQRVLSVSMVRCVDSNSVAHNASVHYVLRAECNRSGMPTLTNTMRICLPNNIASDIKNTTSNEDKNLRSASCVLENDDRASRSAFVWHTGGMV